MANILVLGVRLQHGGKIYLHAIITANACWRLQEFVQMSFMAGNYPDKTLKTSCRKIDS